MDSSEFITWCRGLGLWVSKAGVVSDDVCDYGVVRPEGLQVVGRDMKLFPYEGLKEILYTEIERKLTFAYSKSDVRVINGSKLTSDETVTLLTMTAMPTCMRELDAVMDALFPDIDNKLYFDILNEQMAFDPTLLGLPEEPSGRPILFSDEHVPTYILQMQNRLHNMGFIGKRYPSKEVCLDVFKYRAFKNQRNLFREWLESLEWDGKPRLRRWFIDGLGATAPALEDIGKDQIYLESATEAWFLGTVRRQYEATKVEIVPVFVGGEGIGKGNFLRYTAGYNDAWFIDTSAPLEGAGAEQKFLESIRGRIIVELSESTQFSTPKGAELLKSFVSKTEDQCRKAYAAFQTTSVRRFTLVATSNQNNVFIDTGGGNRRYFPMYCDPNKAILPFDPQYKIIGKEAMEQVWAEAMHIFMNNPGATSFISKEVAELAAIMQEYGTRENSNVSIIDDWLDDPLNGYTEIGSRISKQEIFREILHCDPKSIIPRSIDHAYVTWTNVQKCWRKLRKTVRINGHVSHSVFERIHTMEELQEKKRSNMVSVAPDQVAGFVDVIGLVRGRAKKYGYSKFGDYFPVDGLTAAEIEAILTEGYIYEDGLDTYRLSFMP